MIQKSMSQKSIIELTDLTWEELVEKSGKPIAVMFYAPSCPHCMVMMPHFEKNAEEFKDSVGSARIDVNNNPISASRYGIMATPTIKFFCKGRPVQEIVGGIYPALLKRITEDTLLYGSDCASKSTPLDYNVGYA
jgi:thioredoxin 1